MAHGVSESALPPRHRQSTNGMSRSERDMHSCSSLATNFRPRATPGTPGMPGTPGTPNPLRALSFGTRVRPDTGTPGSRVLPGTPTGGAAPGGAPTLHHLLSITNKDRQPAGTSEVSYNTFYREDRPTGYPRRGSVTDIPEQPCGPTTNTT